MRIRQTPLPSGPSKSSVATFRADTWLGAERSCRVLRATSPKDCPDESCPEESCPNAPQPEHDRSAAINIHERVVFRVLFNATLISIAKNSLKSCTMLPRRRSALPEPRSPAETARPG